MDTKGKKPDQEQDEQHLSRLASVGEIAAGIAHEVKNPLTAVKGFLQLLQEKHDDKYIEIANAELNNALLTLENLLNVSKPDFEDEQYQAINLAAELESLLNLFQDQKYRVQIKVDFRDTNSLIYGKKSQIKKAFFNLLKNSFEAIPEEGFITVKHFVHGDYNVITIEDTGVGIPAEKIALLGTPFFTTKSEGTGMGLTQVYSVIYQHGGKINVHSEEQLGTKFIISLPRETGHSKKTRAVIDLNLNYSDGMSLREFFVNNRKNFESYLLNDAVNDKDKIDEIQAVGNIDLLSNAYKLVLYIVEGREHEVISFAKQEGATWAKLSLTLAFKLEWIQTIRRVIWDFLYNFDRLNKREGNREEFFSLEKSINKLIDQFLNSFFINYSQYKDELIRSQSEMVEKLSVPIIPLTSKICILPLIGNIDSDRILTLEDKVITQIGVSRIEVLIIDLSGVYEMEQGVIENFITILDGIMMLGCKSVITGLRSEIVKGMIRNGLSFENKAVMKGTLQQALVDYLITRKDEEQE